MASNRNSGPRSGLIHCNNCGEDYSASYRRCPFCDEYDDDYYEPPRSSAQRQPQQRTGGGKRLAAAPQKKSSAASASYTSQISFFQVVTILISLAVIIVAFWIVTARLIPLIHRGGVDTIDADAVQDPPLNSDVAADQDPKPDTSPDIDSNLGTVLDPNVQQPDLNTQQPDPDPIPEPSPAVSTAPAPGEATGFTMSGQGDVTLKYKGQLWEPKITFTPAGTTSDLIWESDDPSIASVSASGVVKAEGRGTTNISVMMPNGVTQACIVRCSWTDDDSSSGSSSGSNSGSSSSSGSSSTSSGTYSVNNPDFTFYDPGEQYTLRVTGGYTGSVTWSSSNTAVVTVGSDGTCTAVANGSCNVIGTLDDGSTVKADVYVRIK